MVNFANKQSGIDNDYMNNWAVHEILFQLVHQNYWGLSVKDSAKDQRIDT